MITKASIEALGWEVEEIDEQIYMIKDLASQQEVKEIIKLAEAASEEDWKTHYLNGIRDFAWQKFKRSDLDNLIAEGKLEITHKWIDKNLFLSNDPIRNSLDERVRKIVAIDKTLTFNGVGTIQRQYEGAELVVHVDNHTDPSLVWAVIIYINDDYTDGELIFPDRGLVIKPPSGSMLIFPTHDGYRHGVNPPGPGPKRYVLPSFVGVKDFYKSNTY